MMTTLVASGRMRESASLGPPFLLYVKWKEFPSVTSIQESHVGRDVLSRDGLVASV